MTLNMEGNINIYKIAFEVNFKGFQKVKEQYCNCGIKNIFTPGYYFCLEFMSRRIKLLEMYLKKNK